MYSRFELLIHIFVLLVMKSVDMRQFVTCSLVTNNCYKLLENQNVTKNKTVRDAIFQILGVMVKRFNHTIGSTAVFLLA